MVNLSGACGGISGGDPLAPYLPVSFLVQTEEYSSAHKKKHKTSPHRQRGASSRSAYWEDFTREPQ